MRIDLSRLGVVCVALLACAIVSAAQALDPSCHAPLRIETPPHGKLAAPDRVTEYRVVFEQCENSARQMRLATRRMLVDGRAAILAIDPVSLATTLEDARAWVCHATHEEDQSQTRFVQAIRAAAAAPGHRSGFGDMLRDSGLTHGAGEGSFITGDLCPSWRPLDRDFFRLVEATGFRAPLALSVSGIWLLQHPADFQWLREESDRGALDITWVNHSFHHPFDPWRWNAQDFMLRPGLDRQAEIVETEKLLIAQGVTPSVFFRLPGLVADPALLALLRDDHLITLGTDGWLFLSPPLRPGAILLVHPNGNEPGGLRLFSRLLAEKKLPRPFRPIGEAP